MKPFSLLNMFFIIAMLAAVFSKSQRKKTKNQSKILYDFNREFSFKDLQEKIKNIRNKTLGIQTGPNEEKPEILPGIKIIFLIAIATILFLFLSSLIK
jgi:hypothetical protein